MRPLVLALLGAILIGCASSTARDESARRSWAATADLLLSEWRHGHLSDRYTADTLRVAGEALSDGRYARAADAVERGDRSARAVQP